jgi:hypothetical protein
MLGACNKALKFNTTRKYFFDVLGLGKKGAKLANYEAIVSNHISQADDGIIKIDSTKHEQHTIKILSREDTCGSHTVSRKQAIIHTTPKPRK